MADTSCVPEILLPRSFDIAVVPAVASELVLALAAGPVTLDAAAVAKVDAAALQLLCAAAVAARIAGAPLTWKAVPTALREGARTLALGDLLGLPPSGASELC